MSKLQAALPPIVGFAAMAACVALLGYGCEYQAEDFARDRLEHEKQKCERLSWEHEGAKECRVIRRECRCREVRSP